MESEDRRILTEWARLDSTKIFLDEIKEQRDTFTNDLINVSFDSPNRRDKMSVVQGIIRGITYSINIIEELSNDYDGD